jgi:hypothetical protein
MARYRKPDLLGSAQSLQRRQLRDGYVQPSRYKARVTPGHAGTGHGPLEAPTALAHARDLGIPWWWPDTQAAAGTEVSAAGLKAGCGLAAERQLNISSGAIPSP